MRNLSIIVCIIRILLCCKSWCQSVSGNNNIHSVADTIFLPISILPLCTCISFQAIPFCWLNSCSRAAILFYISSTSLFSPWFPSLTSIRLLNKFSRNDASFGVGNFAIVTKIDWEIVAKRCVITLEKYSIEFWNAPRNIYIDANMSRRCFFWPSVLWISNANTNIL